MKNYFVGLISTLTIAAGLTIAHAEESTMCAQHRELAKQIMIFRQSGDSRAMLDALIYSETGQAIADMAYDRGIVPRAVKTDAVIAFGNFVEGLCLKNTQSDESKGVAKISI